MYVRNIGDFCCNLHSTIHDAMSAIQASGAAACCIVEHENKFFNVLTDGDLRRALLAGFPITTAIGDVIKLKTRDPITASYGGDEATLISVMKRTHVRQLPLLDQGGRVVEVAVLSEAQSPLLGFTSAVIMAGGRGTRLGALTKTCPKPMLPIRGKPILQHIIEKFVSQGVVNYLISVNYLSEVIKSYFKDGNQFGITIHYLEEEEPLGTAGALSLIPKNITNDFIVTNGDILTSVDYSALKCAHERGKSTITICSSPYQVEIPFGVLNISDGSVKRVIEKPVYQYQVSAGIYFLSNRVVQQLGKPRYLDMPELIRDRLNFGDKVGCFPIIEGWSDIGTPAEYSRASSVVSELL